MSVQIGQADVVIDNNGLPSLNLYGVVGSGGNISGVEVGVTFEASGTPPTGNTGAYTWVQLVSKDLVYQDDSQASGQCPGGVPPTGAPELDTSYPDPYVTTIEGAVIPYNLAWDEPSYEMTAASGEVARSFSATRYLMWTPSALTGTYTCDNGTACTIPVPLGTIQATPTGWIFMGDTINTLSSSQGRNQTTWIMNFNGPPPTPLFQASVPGTDPNYGFATWTKLASYAGRFWQCP